MNQQETEQFAAARMHVAHLHNALKALLNEHAALGNRTGIPLNGPLVQACGAVLEDSEPAVKDLLAEADRDAKLVACRAELQSKADALAQVTARLAKIEAAGGQVVEAHREWEPGVSGIADLETAIAVLGETLK